MPPSLLTQLRRSDDARSAGMALVILFLLTSLLGAFASAAMAAPHDNTTVYCITVAPPDANADEPALSCCALGCPIAIAAIPVPSGDGLVLPAEAGRAGVNGPPAVAEPPLILAAGESPRGPPAGL